MVYKTKKEKKSEVTNKKKKYIRPEIYSEELMTFGAVCNGSPGGGRKASAGAPNFCNSARLLS